MRVSTSACVQHQYISRSVCLRARTCVCVFGEAGGGGLLRAVADVSVLNDHLACLA